jgi:hypothetical protein
MNLCIDESQKLSHIFVLLSAMPLLSEATAFRAVCTKLRDGGAASLCPQTSAVLRVVVLVVAVPRNPSIILLGMM